MNFDSNFVLDFLDPSEDTFGEKDGFPTTLLNFETSNSRRSREFQFETILSPPNAKRQRFEDDFEISDVEEESIVEPPEINEDENAFDDSFEEYLAKVDIPLEGHRVDTISQNRAQGSLQQSFAEPRTFQTVIKQPPNHSQFETHIEHRPRKPLTDIVNQSVVHFSNAIEVFDAHDDIQLLPTSVLPVEHQSVFPNFAFFNKIQSLAFKYVYEKDNSIIVSAPTGSGKTVILELAILRLLRNRRHYDTSAGRYTFKVLYIAPLKSICSERLTEWTSKFKHFDLKGLEVTGDTEADDLQQMREANLLFATPEKWDSMTRTEEAYHRVALEIKLVLIDEVHCLNDTTRGSTLEAVVSRMKTMKEHTLDKNGRTVARDMRFLAISATIPNVEDFAEWLGTGDCPGIVFRLNDDQRPVKLKNIVIGYNCPDSFNNFRFETTLTYKLQNVIEDYSESKPTLVFVPTRKSTWTTAEHLIRNTCYARNRDHSRLLCGLSSILIDAKLKQCVTRGVGFHHSGLFKEDRQKLEAAFSNGDIAVLICTSGLAMGVNLPAHLVIIKGTFYYVAGHCEELSETQVLQMTGRAGRPQFDTTATAVVMTKSQNKAKYEALVSGRQTIESNLKSSLIEHLNAEIVLRTITNSHIAMEWIRSTFLYVRLIKNKRFYGIDPFWNIEKTEKRIHEWCLKELNLLSKTGMITMDDDCCDIKPTEVGKLMSKYCISHETMSKFIRLKGTESISDLVEVVSSSKEVSNEIILRTNEKKVLNSLNTKDKTDAAQEIIRFPYKGKIKTKEMKANVLIQAEFGCINVSEPSLCQDSNKVMKSSQRVAKCLVEYLVATHDIHRRGFHLMLNATILAKCLKAKLWNDSIFVTKQLNAATKQQCPRISRNVSRLIANGDITNFESIESASPSYIEMFVNKTPPFGRDLQSMVRLLPKYDVKLKQIQSNATSVTLKVEVHLENMEQVWSHNNHGCYLLIGNLDDELLKIEKIVDKSLIRNNGNFKTEFHCKQPKTGRKVIAKLISDFVVGVDVSSECYIDFDEPQTSNNVSDKWTASTSAATSERCDIETLNCVKNWKHFCHDESDCKGFGIHFVENVKESVAKKDSLVVNAAEKMGANVGQIDTYDSYARTPSQFKPIRNIHKRSKPSSTTLENMEENKAHTSPSSSYLSLIVESNDKVEAALLPLTTSKFPNVVKLQNKRRITLLEPELLTEESKPRKQTSISFTELEMTDSQPNVSTHLNKQPKSKNSTQLLKPPSESVSVPDVKYDEIDLSEDEKSDSDHILNSNNLALDIEDQVTQECQGTPREKNSGIEPVTNSHTLTPTKVHEKVYSIEELKSKVNPQHETPTKVVEITESLDTEDQATQECQCTPGEKNSGMDSIVDLKPQMNSKIVTPTKVSEKVESNAELKPKLNPQNKMPKKVDEKVVKSSFHKFRILKGNKYLRKIV